MPRWSSAHWDKDPRTRRVLPYFGVAGAVIFAALVIVSGWLYTQYTRPGSLDVPVNVVIPKNSGIQQIAKMLFAQRVIDSPWVFSAGVKITGLGAHLKAGEYAFSPSIAPRDVARLLAEGKTVVRRLTVVEGSSVHQVLAQLAVTEGIVGTPSAVPAEGSLLPETYHFSYGDTADEMIARMQKAMHDAVTEIWAKHDGTLPIKNVQEMVTLASIVEKETGMAQERALVAGVFYNRLRVGMRLQSDPTVIYAVTGGKPPLEREISRADLQFDSPYNTYVAPALPPAPIANPGRASLQAVMQPARTDALYFVADGTGGHLFSRTLAEHNDNVARWRRLQSALDEQREKLPPGAPGYGTAPTTTSPSPNNVPARAIPGELGGASVPTPPANAAGTGAGEAR